MLLGGFFLFSQCQSFSLKEKPKVSLTDKSKSEDINDDFFSDDDSSAQDKTQKDNSNWLTGNKNNSAKQKRVLIPDVYRGYASLYGKKLEGQPTASGEIFKKEEFTAAHRNFPFGSIVLIRNLENGRKKLVRINDRIYVYHNDEDKEDAFVDDNKTVESKNMIIQVSLATARDLGFADTGNARVEIELIEKGKEVAQNNSADEDDSALEDMSEGSKNNSSKSYYFPDGSRPYNYTVRTGAFKNIRNAERFRSELEERYNMSAYLGKKGKWHYVWVGDFTKKQDAKKFYRKLKTDGLDVLHPKKVH